MKLRIALKIIKAVTDKNGNITNRHNDGQLQRANHRYGKCQSAKVVTTLFEDTAKAAFRRKSIDRILALLLPPPPYGLIAATAV